MTSLLPSSLGPEGAKRQADEIEKLYKDPDFLPYMRLDRYKLGIGAAAATDPAEICLNRRTCSSDSLGASGNTQYKRHSSRYQQGTRVDALEMRPARIRSAKVWLQNRKDHYSIGGGSANP